MAKGFPGVFARCYGDDLTRAGRAGEQHDDAVNGERDLAFGKETMGLNWELACEPRGAHASVLHSPKLARGRSGGRELLEVRCLLSHLLRLVFKILEAVFRRIDG